MNGVDTGVALPTAVVVLGPRVLCDLVVGAAREAGIVAERWIGRRTVGVRETFDVAVVGGDIGPVVGDDVRARSVVELPDSADLPGMVKIRGELGDDDVHVDDLPGLISLIVRLGRRAARVRTAG